MTKFAYAVGNSSDPAAAEMMYRELKRMARYGRVAERALAEVRASGFCDRRVPGLSRPMAASSWDSNPKGRISGSVVYLPRVVRPERSHLCDMGLLRMEVEAAHESSYSGRPTMAADAFLAGPMMVQWQGGRHEAVERRIRVGMVRLNKGRASFVSQVAPVRRMAADGSAEDYSAAGLYSSLVASKYAREAVELVAAAAAPWLVQSAYDCHDVKGAASSLGAGHFDRGHLPTSTQLTLDLQRAAVRWLVEGGHAERMMAEMYRMVPLLQVQGA